MPAHRIPLQLNRFGIIQYTEQIYIIKIFSLIFENRVHLLESSRKPIFNRAPVGWRGSQSEGNKMNANIWDGN